VSAWAELSAIATSIDELLRRVSAIADEVSREHEEALSTELYEVERSLGVARRRLTRLIESSRP
jgi:hypothetical protein